MFQFIIDINGYGKLHEIFDKKKVVYLVVGGTKYPIDLIGYESQTTYHNTWPIMTKANIRGFVDMTEETKMKKIEEIKEKQLDFQPLGERILVKPDEVEESISGGIIIPRTTKEKPMEGIVIAVGPGKLTQDGKTHALQVKEGDRVLYGKYAGTEIELNKDTYIVISYDDLLGIVKVK